MLSRRQFSLLMLSASAALPVLAQPALGTPKGRVVLSITGKIGVKNQAERAAFDMDMLKALPQHSFTTSTPWFDKPVKFTGPLLSDLLSAVRASGSTVSAVAINDYKVRIPVTDAMNHKMVVARLIDDQPIPVREKGPLFVIYPFDSSAELRSSAYYERSIWQLKALDVQ